MPSFKHKSNFSLIFITFLTSFFIGIIFSFFIAEKAGIPLGKTITKSSINQFFSQNPTGDLDLKRFWEVYNLIETKGYNSSEIDKEKLIDGAIKGLVEGLGDKHSSYMNTKQRDQFESVLDGDFEGIGAVVDTSPLGVKIERIIKGSPALKYGLKAKDIIIRSNGTDLQDLDLYKAIEFIKGPAGTKADLEILREGESEILKITVIRDKIIIPSVNFEKLENNIGYIALNVFGSDTVSEFQKALGQLGNTNGLIIDLRDNGGGYLTAATEILSELIENNKILVVTKYSNIFKRNEEYRSINYGEPYNKPIVVLINENSASASEITAGALHDYKKAILVGKKSYGKGSVQQPYDVDKESLLKLTIAKWFTPNDKNIDKEGIIPDIIVEFKKQDYTPEKGKESEFIPYDRQLETAKKVLDEFIQSESFSETIKKFTSEKEKIEKLSE